MTWSGVSVISYNHFFIPSITVQFRAREKSWNRRFQIPTCVAFIAVRIVWAWEALPQFASGLAK